MSVEADLLAAIVNGDEPSRDVYRDWLEAQAQHERAEFMQLGRATGPGEGERLREVASSPRIDPAWRRLVGRFPIAGCARDGCPRDWSGLRPTQHDDVRSCGVCRREIGYAATTEAADELARAAAPHVVDIAAAPAWIRTNEWQSGNYTTLVRELYPEAAGPRPIEMQRPLQAYSSIVRAHTLNTLFFGWSDQGKGHNKFQVWSGLFAMGPLGFARVSQRPSVVRDLLVAEHFELPREAPDALLDRRTIDDLAVLLSEAYEEPTGPDELRPDRDLYMRSGLLGTHKLTSMDTGDRPELALDRDEWRVIRQRLPGTIGRSGPNTFSVSFAMALAIGEGHVRFDQVTVAIARDDYAFSVERTVAGTAKCDAPARAVIGRPFEVAGAVRRAPLVRRDDWG